MHFLSLSEYACGTNSRLDYRLHRLTVPSKRDLPPLFHVTQNLVLCLVKYIRANWEPLLGLPQHKALLKQCAWSLELPRVKAGCLNYPSNKLEWSGALFCQLLGVTSTNGLLAHVSRVKIPILEDTCNPFLQITFYRFCILHVSRG